jgi:hypothetical protein
MKYIKKYESIIYNLDLLSNHIKDFLMNIKDNNDNDIPGYFIYTTNDIGYKFWYCSKILNKGFFELYNIDYYTGDKNRFFEFRLDLRLKVSIYLSEDIYNAAIFIESVMKNYIYSQNMIPMSKIEHIINDINDDNYVLFKNTNKYNI